MIGWKTQTYSLGSWENIEETMTFQKTGKVKSIENSFSHLMPLPSYLPWLLVPNLTGMFLSSYLCHDVPSA